MSGSEHLIPRIDSKAPFSRLLVLMGFNRWLWGVALAIGIWGFQPVILSPDVRDLRTASDPLFVVIRYGAAFAVFALAYGLLRWMSRLRGSSASPPTTRRTILVALAMGGTMYLSRLFELLSYGPDGNDSTFATFGMIFSIFFVVVWNWKSWAIFHIGHRLKAGWLKARGSPPPTADGVLSWIIQAVLVASAALFFVYAETGHLPSGPEALQSLQWALLSALMLSLYYDLCMQPDRDPDPWVSARELARVHMISTGAVMAFALCHWLGAGLLGNGVIHELFTAASVLQGFGIEQHMKLWIGYVLGITCIGYFGENLGVLLYDKHHRFAWRIEGREWLGLTATMDPFVSVLVTMSPLMIHGPDHHVFWYYLVAAALVAAVTLQSFLRLWSSKQESLRSKALGIVSHAADHLVKPGTSVSPIDLLHWMLRLSMIHRDSYPRLECSKIEVSPDQGLVRALTRCHRYYHDGSFRLTEWSINAVDGHANDIVSGLFDCETSEGRELWRRLAAHITAGTDTKLIRWDEAAAVVAAERRLLCLGELPCHPKGAVAFFSVHALPLELHTQSTPIRIAVRVKSDFSNPGLCEDFVGREAFGRLGGKTIYIDPFERYCLETAEIVAAGKAPDIPRSLSTRSDSQPDLFLVDVGFLRDDIPEWLAGGADTPPVILWSHAHASILVGELLAGEAQVSDRGLPLISDLGRDESQIGGRVFLEAFATARRRNTLSCRILVATADEGVRAGIIRQLRPALIGMRAEIRCPKSGAEFERDIAEFGEHLPLMFFTPTLDGWYGDRQANALVDLKRWLAMTDPYLVQLAGPHTTAAEWPLERLVNLEHTTDFSRAIAGHLGNLKPESRSFRHLSEAEVEERLQAAFAGINADISSWTLRRHCYAIYASCGKSREHGSARVTLSGD